MWLRIQGVPFSKVAQLSENLYEFVLACAWITAAACDGELAANANASLRNERWPFENGAPSTNIHVLMQMRFFYINYFRLNFISCFDSMPAFFHRLQLQIYFCRHSNALMNHSLPDEAE